MEVVSQYKAPIDHVGSSPSYFKPLNSKSQVLFRAAHMVAGAE